MLNNSFNVGGLPVNVYCRDGSANSSKPVVILFLLHGRTQKAEDYGHVVRALLSDEPEDDKKRELYVATFVRKSFIGKSSYVQLGPGPSQSWPSPDRRFCQRRLEARQ